MISFPPVTSKVEGKLWSALERLQANDIARLRNARNVSLMGAGNLEISIASVCREAPASRTTVSNDVARFQDLIDAIHAAEGQRTAAHREGVRKEVDRKIRNRNLENTVVAQASVIAGLMVEVHSLRRRMERVSRLKENDSGDPTLPLGRRKRPKKHETFQQDPDANPDPR